MAVGTAVLLITPAENMLAGGECIAYIRPVNFAGEESPGA